MKKLITQPHDKILKLSLSNKEVAKDFLITHLPKPILKTIKLQTLEICHDSYVTSELESNYSDIVYRVKSNKNNHFYFYTLIEHMSTATWDLPIRMVEYQLSIIANHRKQHPKDKKIPVIIPLLIYNGEKSPYPKTLNIIELFNDPALAQKTFARPAHLIDLTIMSDQAIKKHNIISLLEFSQKHVRDQKFLKQSIKTLVSIINKLKAEYINTNKSLEIGGWFKDYVYGSLHYLFYYAKIIDDQEFIKELETIDFIKEENVMGALARKIEQEGITKGIAKGIAEGEVKGEIKKANLIAINLLKQGQLSVSAIAYATGLTILEVEELQKQAK